MKILFSFLSLIALNSYAFNYHYIDKNKTTVDTLKINNSGKSVIIFSSFDKVKTNIEGGFIDDYVTTLTMYNLYSDSLLQIIKDTSQFFNFPEIRFVDINMDGYADIELRYMNERSTQYSYFWLYDITSNRFVCFPDFELNDYSIDSKDKIIWSSLFYSGYFCSTFSKYKVYDNHLVQFEEEGCSKDSKGNIENYKKGLIDNVLKIVKLDSILFLDSIIVVKSYKIFNDSLLISEIYWLSNKEVGLTDNYNDEIYYESEFTEVKKAIKKLSIIIKSIQREILLPKLIVTKWRITIG